MAEYQNVRVPRYETNGSAAYDLRRYGSAAPQRAPGRGLPEERRRPAPVRRVRAKLAVAPFAVLGMVAVMGMLILVVFSYVRLYEAKSQVGQLTEELTTLQQEQDALTSEYESKIDLVAIEERARAMGMVQPTSVQTVYLDLSGTDRAEVLQEEEASGPLASLLEAFRSSVESLVSYLS